MRWKTPLLLLLIPLLSGCASPEGPTQDALDFRTALLDAGGCAFTAQITADLGDRAYTFQTACDHICAQGTTLTVLEPEEIAGITAHVSQDGAKVVFDDVELDFGMMAEGHVSPMSAPWLLAHCWAEAYIDSAGQDGDLYRITYLEGYNEEELTIDTWLKDQTPIHAEITYDGARCLTLELSAFQYGS